ncbi:MAG: ferritin family protein [Syntrophobacteraceae bacterium]|nr:ferritin family protein [Syntrophobacteraceae bacterium]
MSVLSCHSVRDVVDFAIQKEEKAMEFYQECYERAKNQGIREFFKEMVAEEKGHRDMLKNLDSLDLDNVKLEKVENLKISDYLVDVTFSETVSYQEALIIAMKKEEKAMAFYGGWKDRCMSERASKLFQVLANEEEKHKRKLEKLYDEDILGWN